MASYIGISNGPCQSQLKYSILLCPCHLSIKGKATHQLISNLLAILVNSFVCFLLYQCQRVENDPYQNILKIIF